MSQIRLKKLSELKSQINPYVDLLTGAYKNWSFSHETALLKKGVWRSEVFKVLEDTHINLEIGTGNGFHFAHQAQKNPHQMILGVELKFKPLIQSIRRALDQKSTNARMIRYDAKHLKDLFKPSEINDVFIYFPDPWEKRRQVKNRLIQKLFVDDLYGIQKKNSTLFFKTDSKDYFEHSLKVFEKSSYKITSINRDVHASDYPTDYFLTHFEKIFVKQNLPIYQLILKK